MMLFQGVSQRPSVLVGGMCFLAVAGCLELYLGTFWAGIAAIMGVVGFLAGDALTARSLSPREPAEDAPAESTPIAAFEPALPVEDSMPLTALPENFIDRLEEFPAFVGVLRRQLDMITRVSEDAAHLMLGQLSELDTRLASLISFVKHEQSGGEIGDAIHQIESHLGDYKCLIDELAEQERRDAERAGAFRARMAEETREVLAALEGVNVIARQTTMLSFNASIEAARAGEVGAGFSVIGNEIRVLAGEVRTLADELHERIRSMMSSICADLVAQAGDREQRHRETMDRISDFLGGLSDRLGIVLDQQIVGHHNRIIERVAHENERLAEPMMTMMGSIQFQDIVRQQVEHIINMSLAVGEYVAAQGGNPEAVDWSDQDGRSLSDVLNMVAKNCVMEEQRAIHRSVDGDVPKGDPAVPKIELF